MDSQLCDEKRATGAKGFVGDEEADADFDGDFDGVEVFHGRTGIRKDFVSALDRDEEVSRSAQSSARAIPAIPPAPSDVDPQVVMQIHSDSEHEEADEFDNPDADEKFYELADADVIFPRSNMTVERT